MSDRDPAAPDPIGDLENFSLEGDPVHPLPASEVRRRGDRLRRRRTGVLVVGAAAAIAVIVTSTVVAATNLNQSEAPPIAPGPSESTTSSPSMSSESASAPSRLTEIPEDFPIGTDLDTTDGDSQVHGPGPKARGAEELTICNTTYWPSPHASSRLAVTYTAPEYADSRELVTFSDAKAAADFVDGLRSAVLDCPDDGTQVLTSLEADTGYDSSVTFAMTYRESLGRALYQAVRVGNAVLFTVETGEGTLAEARDAVPDRTSLAEKLTPRMCVFTEAGC